MAATHSPALRLETKLTAISRASASQTARATGPNLEHSTATASATRATKSAPSSPAKALPTSTVRGRRGAAAGAPSSPKSGPSPAGSRKAGGRRRRGRGAP